VWGGGGIFTIFPGRRGEGKTVQVDWYLEFEEKVERFLSGRGRKMKREGNHLSERMIKKTKKTGFQLRERRGGGPL